ncbi:unnamed protein product [Mycena citricolor]|uniref:Uncharacterized protein n=1 Tax=Mycena citricolor TaxID=2018698 RepID=A0AAD2K2I3_9AGAR|nr:unnamed protein product [Mycena citricolor]
MSSRVTPSKAILHLLIQDNQHNEIVLLRTQPNTALIFSPKQTRRDVPLRVDDVFASKISNSGRYI